jgi:hypothetical protein
MGMEVSFSPSYPNKDNSGGRFKRAHTDKVPRRQ